MMATARTAALTAHSSARDLAAFADEVRAGLSVSPRSLPTRFLYDTLGSALFDAICRLPWYPLTSSELRLLVRHGGQIIGGTHALARIVEFGSGNGEKLRALLDAAAAVRPAPLDVHVADLSTAALAQADYLLKALPGVRVRTHAADYEQDLSWIGRHASGGGRTLALCLGSNIGNYEPDRAAALLQSFHDALRPGDVFLLGTDLVKPEAALLLAYDDPLGVTAAFNRNLLVRINRELGGNFDLAAFAHRAVWNLAASRIEMHLVSRGVQSVRVPGAGVAVTFEDGETIWTESSYKYRVTQVRAMLAVAGFTTRAQWVDPVGQFALTLAEVDPAA